MPPKLLPLNEAASLLGVTPDALNDMRLRQQIYGYRDGTSWKFKLDELERLKEERAAAQSSPLAAGDDQPHDATIAFSTPAPAPSPADSGLGLPVLGETGGDGDDDELVLLSEVELGESGTGTSSTIIGSAAKPPVSEDSDLKLGDSKAGVEDSGLGLGDSGLGLGDSGLQLGESDLVLEASPGSDAKKSGSSPAAHESDVRLVTPDDNVLGSGSELPLGLSESATVVKSSSSSSVPLGDSGLLNPGSSGSGFRAPMGDSGLSLASDDDLKLASDGGSGGSSLHLADEDVLAGGSGSGSDITHRPSDSGILLIDPSDSGLALDKPLELTGGSDPMMETTDFSSQSGELKSDDDFLLTPLEEATEDESDSGSQVIMLDTEGEFDDATATLLASQIPGMEASLMVDESPLAGLGGMGEMAGRPGSAIGAGAAPTMIPARAEIPFSALSVVGLAACTVALAITGIMMYDLVRNMWGWNSNYGVDTILIQSFGF